MNFSKRNKSIVDFLFILALFGAFAITGLLVVLFGARVYEKTVASMDANYSSRTTLSYVTEKIRAHDFSGGANISFVNVDDRGKIDVLTLKERIGEKVYVTYMFMDSDGYLKEFTTSDDYDFKYNDGTKIIALKTFDVEKKSDSLYYFDIVDSFDNRESFFVTLYSGTDGEDINE